MAKRQDQAGRTHHRPPPSAHEAPPDRERLLTLAASPAVTVVEAPSGYGKTVLARSWLRAAPAGARTLWVSLSAVARDPAVFLEQLAKALRGACVDRIGGSLDDEAGLAGWFARITDELAEAADPIRLVLDDAHTLAGSASCPYLQRLLLGASPRLQMMVTLQPADADVGLGVMATQQDVRWLTASHLALTAEEIAACAQARGQQLSPAQREGLHNATQGWPALVQLALAVPLERQFVMPDTVAGLGPVRDYIYARFLSHLGPGEHRLMQQLACLGTAPLQLLSTLPGQDLRRDLGRLLALGIVQPVEPATAPTVRLHPLVQDTALRVLDITIGERERLLLTAAHWYWAQDLGPTAVSAALDAGAPHLSLARSWLCTLGDRLMAQQGPHQLLIDLITRWEHLANEVDPTLSLHAVWALVFQRRFAPAEDRLRALPDDAHRPVGEVALLRGCIAALRDDYDTGGRMAHAWLAQAGPGPSFQHGAAWTVYAFHLRCNSDIEGAQRALREAHAAFAGVQSGYGTVWAYIIGALTELRAGRYRDALAEVEHGLTLCADSPGFDGQRAMLHAVAAFVRYERNELAVADAALELAMPLLPRQGIVDTIALGFTAAARLRAARGDLGPALDLLTEGERSGVERDFRKLSVSLCAERALILARSGAGSQARQLAERATAPAGDPLMTSLLRDRQGRLQARLALSEGEAAHALNILTPMLAHARDSTQRYKQCELLTLTALAEDALGHETAAWSALDEALSLAGSEGYIRVFIDEGAELLSLLERWHRARQGAPDLRIELAWAETVLRATDAPTRPSATADAPFEALNRRERQMLGLLEQGLSNAQIAARCFLVEGTVKWHLHNLYTKFGVRSRTAALRAAREHGLL